MSTHQTSSIYNCGKANILSTASRDGGAKCIKSHPDPACKNLGCDKEIIKLTILLDIPPTNPYFNSNNYYYPAYDSKTTTTKQATQPPFGGIALD